MSKPKTSGETAVRARTAVRAQRWAMKHRPKPRPSRRHPVLVAAAVMLGGLLAGILVGTGLEYGQQRGRTWVLPLTPVLETASPLGPAAQLEDGGADLLVPAAGPGDAAAGTGGFAYEEP
jgi:hypothetical protein